MRTSPQQYGSILIVCESREGDLEPVSVALAGEAMAWGRSFDQHLDVLALVIGDAEGAGTILGPHGVQKVFQCADPVTGYGPEVLARTVTQLAHETGSEWIFFYHSSLGSHLAPRVSALLSAGLVSRCLTVEHDGDRGYRAVQPIHDGRLYRLIGLAEQGIKVLSWEPGVLARREPLGEDEAGTIVMDHATVEDTGPVRALRIIKGDPRTLPVEKADRVVAVGRGMIPEGLDLIGRVADRIEASIGGTRPVIDAEFLPFERQIGQTGVTVSPRFLLACGISGANEFTVGITDSQVIVAVNKDANAPILGMADLGLIGDGHEILSEFLRIRQNFENSRDS